MKKAISVLLAVMMLAALMIPAFAATLDQTRRRNRENRHFCCDR